MQEETTNKENSDALSVRQKSIYQKEIASTVYPTVFSTKVCWVSLQQKNTKPCRSYESRFAYNIKGEACEACICTICMAEDHGNHEFELLEKAAHKEKTYIMSSVETIKERANMFRAVIGKFEKTCDDVEIIIAIAKQEVSQAAEHIIAKIRQEEGTLLQSLEVTGRKRLERINSAKKEVESLVKQLNQAAEFAENLVQRSSSTDIMQSKETLKKN